jgi:alcohol dehydrogenase (cytochrome c)
MGPPGFKTALIVALSGIPAGGAGRSVADIPAPTARIAFRLSRIRPTTSPLRPVWVYQPPGNGSVESTPVVVNGVMYVTSGPTMVAALDLKSGKPLWEWTRPIAPSVLNLGSRVNRGWPCSTTWSTSGRRRLSLRARRPRRHQALVGARRRERGQPLITPHTLVVGDKVIVGISGGEAGIRGFLMPTTRRAENGRGVSARSLTW